MYIYPDNLKQKATMWLWRLGDLVILCVAALLSFFLLIRFFFIPPMAVTLVYAFLTIQFEGSSIKDFLQYALNYFIAKPQRYVWEIEYDHQSVGDHSGNPAKHNRKAKGKHPAAR